jgi:predicted transcriptional regulator of viral defense system
MPRATPQKDLVAFALGQHGFLSVPDAQALGIDPVRLRQMAHRGVLERVSHGVYRLAHAPVGRLDDYMAATLWPRRVRGVISHESALDLHDLCDVNPEVIDITVPRSYRPGREVPKRYRLHRRDLAPVEETTLDGIPIVTPARAILDGIEANLRTGLIREAIDTLRRRDELAARDEERIFVALSRRRRAV